MTLLIGADPEFTTCTYAGEKRFASDFLPAGNSHHEENPKLGCDGHGETGEMRPSAKTCPLELSKEILQLIKEAKTKLKWYMKINAGHYSNGEFTGGHVHFNISKSHEKFQEIVRALDIFLAVPFMLISNQPKFSKRIIDSPNTRGSGGRTYGALSDVRFPSHGGFEYRTLGSWIYTPQLTEGVLCLAYTIVSGVLSQHITASKQFYNTIIDGEKYVRGDKKHYRSIALYLYSVIKSAPMFEKYKSQIMYIFALIAQNKELNENSDAFLEWNVKTKEEYKSRYTISPDEKLSDIFNKEKIEIKNHGLELYVYGIKDNKEPDKYAFIIHPPSLITKIPEKYHKSCRVATQGETAIKYGASVGFSLEMRKKKKRAILNIVKNILTSEE